VEKLIYGLCAVTSALCAVLLLRAYFNTRFSLLMWSGACFVGLTANNVLLVLDRLVFTSVDMSTCRLAVALCALILLLCGLIMESGS
jgi:hypothetical protein